MMIRSFCATVLAFALTACAESPAGMAAGQIVKISNSQGALIDASVRCRNAGGLLKIRSTDPLSGSVLANCDSLEPSNTPRAN